MRGAVKQVIRTIFLLMCSTIYILIKPIRLTTKDEYILFLLYKIISHQQVHINYQT